MYFLAPGKHLMAKSSQGFINWMCQADLDRSVGNVHFQQRIFLPDVKSISHLSWQACTCLRSWQRNVRFEENRGAAGWPAAVPPVTSSGSGFSVTLNSVSFCECDRATSWMPSGHNQSKVFTHESHAFIFFYKTKTFCTFARSFEAFSRNCNANSQ